MVAVPSSNRRFGTGKRVFASRADRSTNISISVFLYFFYTSRKNSGLRQNGRNEGLVVRPGRNEGLVVGPCRNEGLVVGPGRN